MMGFSSGFFVTELTLTFDTYKYCFFVVIDNKCLLLSSVFCFVYIDQMYYFLIQKRSISIGLALSGLALITVLYVGSSADNYYINIQKFQLYRGDNRNFSSVRVCCLILTSPKNFRTHAKAVNRTWGPHCDRYFFITEYNEENMTSEQINIGQQLPIAPIKNITVGYDHLTQKSTLAFLFVYENYFNDFDWFIKADDDTYLIVEHLKAFLSKQNSSEPVTFGYNFKVITLV
jgi:hypothetical protein